MNTAGRKRPGGQPGEKGKKEGPSVARSAQAAGPPLGRERAAQPALRPAAPASPGLGELGLPPAGSAPPWLTCRSFSEREMKTWALSSGSLGPREAVGQMGHRLWVGGTLTSAGAWGFCPMGRVRARGQLPGRTAAWGTWRWGRETARPEVVRTKRILSCGHSGSLPKFLPLSAVRANPCFSRRS